LKRGMTRYPFENTYSPVSTRQEREISVYGAFSELGV
jgi:hypothetical protein